MREYYCFWKNSGFEKFYGWKGCITFFRRTFSVSECRKNSWPSFQCFRKFGVSKKFMHNRGYHVFPSKNSGVTVQKKSWAPLQHFTKFGVWKILCIREGGGITFLRRKILSNSTKNLCWGTLRCFRKFRVSQEFMHSKGISLNSVEKFLSHSSDKFPGSALLCFERILESKIFKQKRGKLQGFLESFFYLTGPKKFRQGTILRFTNFLVVEKCLWMRGGVITIFLQNFLSHCAKKFHWRTIFCFKKFFNSKLLMHISSGASRFCRNFLSHRTETKSFVKDLFCFPEKLW